MKKISQIKTKKRGFNPAEFDDEALEILYQWANNAILCRQAQVQDMITLILTEYEQRGLRHKLGYQIKIDGWWVKEYRISRVIVCDDPAEAWTYDKVPDWVDGYAKEHKVEIIELGKDKQ